ncbi:MAG: glycoside hydrolase 105 family protein [Micrococcales bacterium 73-15]|uniref:beta-galactosidase BglB n=1 Tax=Salana multivorans TaxID=120377 RepID=UPI0009684CE7|nr:glycoside hydrolase family 88 protein [Salana multivorans]OJX96897.1 MAG: glycoside hydrolase 105 family protein [Micrococcales bacterium 73-15]
MSHHLDVWPVKHSELLRVPERLVPLAELDATVLRVVDNLVGITDETGEFLLRLDDGRTIDTKGWAGWEWTHGVGLYGMWQYYDQTDHAGVRDLIDDWFTARLAEGTTKNVNTMAPMLTLALRYEETGDKRLLPWLDAWAEWAMRTMPRTPHGGMQHVTLAEENHHQLWDDTLMMTVLPLAKIGLLLDRPEYVDEATFQFLTHVAYLMDRETGLWFHGWTFDDGGHNFARARWARGNSWLTIVIPDFIELLDLPERHPVRRFLVEVLDAQVAALARLQDASGLWHTLLDDPSSYLEASATAGFAYGILKAVRKGYLPTTYRETAVSAVRAILANIDDAGELQQVSFGTGMGSDLEFYHRVPLTSMPYGQAMAILALGEYRHTYY